MLTCHNNLAVCALARDHDPTVMVSGRRPLKRETEHQSVIDERAPELSAVVLVRRAATTCEHHTHAISQAQARSSHHAAPLLLLLTLCTHVAPPPLTAHSIAPFSTPFGRYSMLAWQSIAPLTGPSSSSSSSSCLRRRCRS
eukprot:scaffold22443_cov112-Isochrysis_galbana.AAC.5